MKLQLLKQYAEPLFYSLERSKNALVPQHVVFAEDGVYAPSMALLTVLRHPCAVQGALDGRALQRLLAAFKEVGDAELKRTSKSFTVKVAGSTSRLAAAELDIKDVTLPDRKLFGASMLLNEEFVDAVALAMQSGKLRYTHSGYLAGVHVHRTGKTSCLVAGTDAQTLSGAHVTLEQVDFEYLLLPLIFCHQLVNLARLPEHTLRLAWCDQFFLLEAQGTPGLEVYASRLERQYAAVLRNVDILGLVTRLFDALNHAPLYSIPDGFDSSLRRLDALRPRGGKLQCEVDITGDKLLVIAGDRGSEIVEEFKLDAAAEKSITVYADAATLRRNSGAFPVMGVLENAIIYCDEQLNRFSITSVRAGE